MRVTFCIADAPGDVGGGNSWIRRLLPALVERGLEANVIARISGGDPALCPTVQALLDAGIPCRTHSWPTDTCDEVRAILSALRDDSPDVFVPNLLVGGFYAAASVRDAGVPTVGVVHSDDMFHLRGLVGRFATGPEPLRLTAIVCVSKRLNEVVADAVSQRVSVLEIPYGVPVPGSTATPPNPKGPFRLVYAGRLVEEQKQISLTTSALCRVVREQPGTEAVIYGEGPDRERMLAVLDREGREFPIRWGGRVDPAGIQDLFRGCHAFVLLSDYEGLPVALLEAMAVGLVPVCLRTRSGVHQVIEHGRSGLLVEDRGGGFMAAIRRLRDEPGLYSELAAGARRVIAEGYSVAACADRWADFLVGLAAGARLRRPIEVPGRIDLPPPHPDMAAYGDVRREALPVGVLRRLRRWLDR